MPCHCGSLQEIWPMAAQKINCYNPFFKKTPLEDDAILTMLQFKSYLQTMFFLTSCRHTIKSIFARAQHTFRHHLKISNFQNTCCPHGPNLYQLLLIQHVPTAQSPCCMPQHATSQCNFLNTTLFMVVYQPNNTY